MPAPSTSSLVHSNTRLMTWINNAFCSLISLLSLTLPSSAAEAETNNHKLLAGYEPLYVMHQSSMVDQRGQINLVVVARSLSGSFPT